MRYVWITLLVSVFVAITVLVPVYVEKIESAIVETAPVVTEEVDTEEDIEPYPGIEPMPTLEPYPEPRPTQSFPIRPVCHEYWFEGVFMGWICVNP